MPVVKQRVSPVIYVAASARELPADVQHWLEQAENRALAAPHVYDMLAQLARGKRFSAMIVSIQSVDWGEMEFFDLAARLARNTPIFVAGTTPQTRAKLEAACRRGARMFDPIALRQELSQAEDVASPLVDVPPSRVENPFVIRSEPPAKPSPEPVAPVAETPEPTPEAVAPASTGLEATGLSVPRFEGLADRLASRLSEPEPAVQPVEPAVQPSPPVEEAAAFDERVESRPAFRLAPAPMEDAEECPVVFPWSTNPNRPKRTPPGGAPSAPAPAASVSPASDPPAQPEQRNDESPLKSVRLTAEEIAALMAEPVHRDSQSEAQS